MTHLATIFFVCFNAQLTKLQSAFVSQKHSAAEHLRFFYRGEQEEQNIIASFLKHEGGEL